MAKQELVDAVAKLINPELFQLPYEGPNTPHQRFVDDMREKARQIIALVENGLVH